MKNIELIAIWLSTDYVFDNGPDRRCVIGTVRLLDKTVKTVKGYCNDGDLLNGITYRFYGSNRHHHKYGEQFNFNSFVEEEPVDEESVIAYLENTCRKPDNGSITRRVALALFEAFGIEAIERVKTDPVGASEVVKQWDSTKAWKASHHLNQQSGTQRCKLALIKILDGRRFPKKTMDNAIKEWGARAAEVIRENPYKLMDLPGIGFKGADKLYCDLSRETAKTNEEYQVALAAIHRQGLCVVHTVSMESRSSGSTWIPAGQAKASVVQLLGSAQARPDDAIVWAFMEGYLVLRDDHVAVSSSARHELEIAEFVTGSDSNNNWPCSSDVERFAPEGKPLSEHQLSAIYEATTKRVTAIQGSPGVGKTFAVACIVKAIIHCYGRDSVAVCAPTGKAAVRVGQSLAANGVDLQATTIHRLLGVESTSGSGWTFCHNEHNPLPFRFLVCDESSMIDVDLMASLLRACNSSIHILFVGDIHQLAPVGHGRPFYDLQKCIPVGHLTEIRRNSGRIVKSCAEIRDYQRITFSPKLDLGGGENMPLVQVADEDQIQAMEKLIASLSDGSNDPINDIQILTGKNDYRKELNAVLQKLMNPNGTSIMGNPFRHRDKIVCLKNGRYPDEELRHVEHFVANGELGRVVGLEPGRMVVQLSDPDRTILVTHAPVQANSAETSESEDSQRGAVGDWDLGYCLSVHRSQGSQWPYVIVMVTRAAGMVQSRNWTYTAISRAETLTYVIGLNQVVNQSLRRDGINGRKTFLVERITGQRLAATVDYAALFGEV